MRSQFRWLFTAALVTIAGAYAVSLALAGAPGEEETGGSARPARPAPAESGGLGARVHDGNLWSNVLHCSVDPAGQHCLLKVVTDKRFIDFGRTDDLRRIVPTDIVQRDALPRGNVTACPPIPTGVLTGVGNDGLPLPQGLTGMGQGPPGSAGNNLCEHVAIVGTGPGAVGPSCLDSGAFQDVPSQGAAGHIKPLQYRGGMTCAYAVISPPPPGQLQLGFTLPAEHLTGDFYAAVPVPTAAQGSAQIRLVNGSGQTVADVLPDGLIEGSVIDSFEKMDAYNATLAFLANNRALPADPVLAGYSLLQPLPPGTAPVPVVPPPPLQALPIIWEAPDDPDGGINTHDCFGHWFEVPVPQCEVQRAGTIVVEASMNNFATDAGQAPEDVTATDFVRYESQAHGGMCGPATPSGGCQDPGFPHDCGAVCCPPDNPFYCEATNLCYALEQEALTACEGVSCLGCAARGAGGGGTGDGGGDGTGQIRVKVVTTQSEDPNDEIGEPLSDVHVLIGSTDVAIGGENVARTTVAPGTYVVKYPSDNGLNAEDGTPLDRVGFVNVHVTKESGPGTRCAPTSQEGDVTVTFDPSAANPEAESEYELGIRIVPFDAPALEGGVTCQ